MSGACVITMLVTAGLAMVVFGVYVWMGGCKRLYVVSMMPVIAPQAYKNAFIPLGISTILLGLSLLDAIPTAEMRLALFGYLVVPLFVISIILGIWSPSWLKPRWLVYLEDTYNRSFTEVVLLPAAARDPDWPQRMRTLEDVKLWAAGVAEHDGFPPPPDRTDRET